MTDLSVKEEKQAEGFSHEYIYTVPKKGKVDGALLVWLNIRGHHHDDLVSSQAATES